MTVFMKVCGDFFEHNHVARWQAEDFERLIDNLPAGHAVFLEDFSMDYAHVHQNEVQGKFQGSNEMQRALAITSLNLYLHSFSLYHCNVPNTIGDHWTHWTSTLFPVVVYYRSKDGQVWAFSYSYLSPDGKHDNSFVQHVNEHLIEEIKNVFKEELKRVLEVVHFVSDGCRGQFKLKKQWSWLSTLKQKLKIQAHSPTHSPTHSLTHTLTHSLTH